MKKEYKNVIVESGRLGSDQSIINTSGINTEKFDKGGVLYLNHDFTNPIGTVTRVGSDPHGNIVADISLKKNIELGNEAILDLYPSIGYKVDDYKTDKQTAVKLIGECTLLSISLTTSRNSDDKIKSLGEQSREE